MSVNAKMTAIADAIRGKTGKSDPLTLDQMAVEIAGFGQGGGIGAIKLIDVDITVEASTATAVTYTVDGLELTSSVENPNKWDAFSTDDTYIAIITPKEITGTATGNTTAIYNRSLHIMYGNTNYTPSFNIISYDANGVNSQSFGIYAPTLNCDSIVDGKIMGHITVSVRHNSSGAYEVIAGTYNIQVYYLTSFDWGHTS